MSRGPRALVNPPQRPAPRMGLIASSATNIGPNPTITDSPSSFSGAPPRWTMGFAFQAEPCGVASIIDPCAPNFGEGGSLAGPLVQYDPFLIWTNNACRPRVGPAGIAEAAAIARRMVERMTPMKLEAEFEGGAFAATTPAQNNYLQNPGSLTDITDAGGTTPLAYALTRLQEYLADCGDGGRGMIHAPREVVSQWQSAYLVGREPGSLLITDLYENIIVAGVGYTGGSPLTAATTEVAWDSAPASGTITYSFPGVFIDGVQVEDVTVAFNAAAGTVLAALEASLGAAQVVSVSDAANATHTITWGGDLTGYALEPEVTCSAACDASVTGTPGSSTVDSTHQTAWAYATSMTQVRLTDPFVTPDPSDMANQGGPDLFDDNEVLFYAQRFAAATWDGCCHAAINVNLCETCCVPEVV